MSWFHLKHANKITFMKLTDHRPWCILQVKHHLMGYTWAGSPATVQASLYSSWTAAEPAHVISTQPYIKLRSRCSNNMTVFSDLTKQLPYCKQKLSAEWRDGKNLDHFNRLHTNFQLYLRLHHRQLYQRYQCSWQANVFQVFPHLTQLQ